MAKSPVQQTEEVEQDGLGAVACSPTRSYHHKPGTVNGSEVGAHVDPGPRCSLLFMIETWTRWFRVKMSPEEVMSTCQEGSIETSPSGDDEWYESHNPIQVDTRSTIQYKDLKYLTENGRQSDGQERGSRVLAERRQRHLPTYVHLFSAIGAALFTFCFETKIIRRIMTDDSMYNKDSATGDASEENYSNMVGDVHISDWRAIYGDVVLFTSWHKSGIYLVWMVTLVGISQYGNTGCLGGDWSRQCPGFLTVF
ncbi:hypothetical protein EDD18DRAFT_1102100 [Armillaria luteobubalina]|uniref:Uncharacterized protein n=1 Tax=Armillaria luteobubalina TaxID=153913 RepID=A0AA39QGC1_9AGAR|nr:hypothetical protein EDD18DRAFT_1102100 [Armillaria luteobubalina]